MTIPLPLLPDGMIDLPGACLRLWPQWLAPTEADALFAGLRADLPWEVHRIRLFGREVDSPRLSCWMGEPEARYRYSGALFAPHPWHPGLKRLADRLRQALEVPFNSVLANRYRDGRDAMGWHSDDEPELGDAPAIASISLGTSRRFLLKHRERPETRLALDLPHGSLLLMAGETQRHYRHALPRTARPIGERINLTFRWIQPRSARR